MLSEVEHEIFNNLKAWSETHNSTEFVISEKETSDNLLSPENSDVVLMWLKSCARWFASLFLI